MRKIVLLHLCLALSLATCAKNKSSSISFNSSKPIVAVTIVPQKTIVQAIAKDDFSVLVMVPPGYSPENYEPKPKNLALFSKAKLYFSIGMPNEKNQIIPSLQKNTILVDLQKEIEQYYPHRILEEHHHHHKDDKKKHRHSSNTHHDSHAHHVMVDPHIWLSPKRAIKMTQIICTNLQALVNDPQKQEEYAANADEFIARIKEVDKKISLLLKSMPLKTFYVFHPAFGYFADEYGLTMISLEKDGKESTAKHLAAVSFEAKRMGAKKIFYQSEIDSQQTKAFATEIGGKSVMLDPLSSDFPNNLLEIAKEISSSFEL